MTEQERKIVRLLINEMAFEGAMQHFGEAPPDLPIEMFHSLERIGIPAQYNGEFESYRYVEVKFDPERSVFENCYRHLRTIRNNIIHANKAYLPDPPERLIELLDWSESFIELVYESDSALADRAREIKAMLKIKSF